MELNAQRWDVTRDGLLGTVLLSDQGVAITIDGETALIAWSSGPIVHFPTPYSVDISCDGAQSVLGFQSTSEQRDFRSALSEMMAEVTQAGAAVALPPTLSGPASKRAAAAGALAGTSTIPMTTLTHLHGQTIVTDHGLVTANVAISRPQWSDLGSELKSLGGGNIGGIEKAMDSGIDQVRRRLSEEAWIAGGNAVVGVSLAFTATERAGAQLMVMIGTAVTSIPSDSAGSSSAGGSVGAG